MLPPFTPSISFTSVVTLNTFLSFSTVNSCTSGVSTKFAISTIIPSLLPLLVNILLSISILLLLKVPVANIFPSLVTVTEVISSSSSPPIDLIHSICSFASYFIIIPSLLISSLLFIKK